MYSLLYEEVDEGGVEIVRILGFPCTQADLRPDVEEFRYLYCPIREQDFFIK